MQVHYTKELQLPAFTALSQSQKSATTQTHEAYTFIDTRLRSRYHGRSCVCDIILLFFFQNPSFKTLRQSVTSMGQTVGLTPRAVY